MQNALVVNAAGFRREWTNRARPALPDVVLRAIGDSRLKRTSLCSAQPRRIIAFARIACNLVMNTYVPRTWSGGPLICRRVTSGGLWNAGTAERTACSWTLRPTRVMSPDSISGPNARYNCDTKVPAQTLETRKSPAFSARVVTQRTCHQSDAGNRRRIFREFSWYYLEKKCTHMHKYLSSRLWLPKCRKMYKNTLFYFNVEK